jgi:hypothetical protein
MAQAKLLEITRRAHFRITEGGREVLQENPPRVDVELFRSPQRRQPLSGVFRGTEHLGAHGGHDGPKRVGAVCDPTAFSGVVGLRLVFWGRVEQF